MPVIREAINFTDKYTDTLDNISLIAGFVIGGVFLLPNKKNVINKTINVKLDKILKSFPPKFLTQLNKGNSRK